MKVRFDQRSLRIALLAFGAITAAVGGALWLWNPEPDVRSRGADHIATTTKGTDDMRSQSSVDNSSIIAANIFSPARTPPRRRYDPADGGSPDDTGVPADMGQAEAMQPEPLPQLFGTVVGPGGAMALMQGDSATGQTRLFREGERIGGYRLFKIKANSVIVSGPSGRIEIQVERNPTGAQ